VGVGEQENEISGCRDACVLLEWRLLLDRRSLYVQAPGLAIYPQSDAGSLSP